MKMHQETVRPTSPQRRWTCVAQAALALSASALLAGCGGGGSSGAAAPPPGGVALQVVSFGDSLSDVGTYAVGSVNVKGPLTFGGGRFTTNPGQVWTQDVANYYGGSLTAASVGGFGFTPVADANGFGYAQGGAMVTNPQGIGWAANNAEATTVPVVTQVSNYLSAHGSFNSNQLVLVNGGANDVLVAAQIIAANPTNVSVIATEEAAVEQAAIDLAGAIGTILQHGATKVVVSNVPDIGVTPEGVSSSDGGALLTSLSSGFNTALTTALTSAGIQNKVIMVDAFGFLDGVVQNFHADGFSVGNTGTGCNLTELAAANPQLASSLFCSPDVYTVAGADQSYVFADLIHPTTRTHALFAQLVEQKVAAAGIGH